MKMPRFSDKVAIVTGSSNGIGRAAALLFAKEGAKVTITGRNVERLEETKRQILSAGVPANNVNVVVADVTSGKGQDDVIGSTVRKFGKIDILVNNAGAAIPDKQGVLGIRQGIETYDATLNLNIRSVVELTKKAVPYLAQTKGELINVSAIAAGPCAFPDFSYYAMAKAALNQYTRNSAISLIEQGIRVNGVVPGIVNTGFGDAMGVPPVISEKLRGLMANNKHCIPAGFMGQPEDIAAAIAFLADRKRSAYIIGHQLVVDGGTSLIIGGNTVDFSQVFNH